MTGNYNKDEPDTFGGLLPAALRGLVWGIAVALVLALVLSGVALATDDPSKLLGAFALTALFAGALAGGIAAGKANPDAGFAAGLCGGAFYVLLLWLVSLFFRGGETSVEAVSPLGMVLGYAGCLAFAALGGLLARPRKKKIGEGKHSPAALARKQMKSAKR